MTEVSNWMWKTNLAQPENGIMGNLKNTVKMCHSRWHIENKRFKEIAGTWSADHVYRHSENAIIVFILFLFIATGIFNIFRKRNIKDKSIEIKVFLIGKIKAGFHNLKRPLPPIPIPI